MVHWMSREMFSDIAESAHMICFKEVRPRAFNTFDFALLADDNTGPLAYATCIEMDAESVYMQHGGAFPSSEGTVKVKRAYGKIIDELRGKYKRASTRIQNTNVPMLKLAMSEGFIVNGIDCFNHEVFCHLQNDFGG